MKSRINLIRDTFKHIRAGSIIFAIVVVLITAGISVFVGVRVHDRTKELLTLKGELNSKEAAMEYNRYLLTRVDIITMVGSTVDNLLESGAGNKVIEDYLMEETKTIINSIDSETTGLYGYFNGTYIDGSGWVPDPDYEPTERPWYIQTMHSNQEITFVDPYVDMQTKTVMMTVSTLLDDGESILAMDVSLNTIQEILQKVAGSTEGGQAFLLDSKGQVIAHSDESQLGKNFMDETDSVGGIVAHKILDEGLMQFEVKTPEGNYVVYVDNLEGGWYSVSAINSDIWHRPLHRTMFLFAAIIFLIALAIISVFLNQTAKNVALQELNMRVDEEEKRGDKLQELSEKDRMTGLNDRVSAERKVNEHLMMGDGGLFLELDIDKFKSINDTYGHQTGDDVIMAVANNLRNTFRTNDVTMRLGGDEFGVFAVGIVNKEMGEAIIRRLFKGMENLAIPELQGEKVSISVGAVICPEGEHRSFHELYSLADKALYISKKTSGNSLTFSED